MRLVVIGDLHGCLEELRALVKLSSLDGADCVTCVGDFMTKGPMPVECLDFWRDRGWQAVLGNNDHDVLRVIRGHANTKGLEGDARLLERRPDLVEYLASRPVALDFADLDAAVVHGGLLPDDSFPEIVGREEMLTLRDVVRGDEGWRAARDDDPPESRVFWAEAWNGNRFVVYGHTPRPAVVRHSRALGIDTGCVYGWSLTAAIRSEDGSWTTRSVPAQRAWSER